jgi:hypothetical protein
MKQTESLSASDDASCSSSSVEDAVVAMIRSRGKVGRRKYRTTMDRKDLHPDEWIEHHQQELADALQYAERIKGATKLLHEARDIMLTLLHERDWECAADWVECYHAQFFPPTNVKEHAPSPARASAETGGEG